MSQRDALEAIYRKIILKENLTEAEMALIRYAFFGLEK